MLGKLTRCATIDDRHAGEVVDGRAADGLVPAHLPVEVPRELVFHVHRREPVVVVRLAGFLGQTLKLILDAVERERAAAIGGRSVDRIAGGDYLRPGSRVERLDLAARLLVAHAEQRAQLEVSFTSPWP